MKDVDWDACNAVKLLVGTMTVGVIVIGVLEVLRICNMVDSVG